jgi:hypothetical protein
MAMKARLFAVALVLTSLALVSGLPASASTLCPATSCFTAGQACVNSGGAPVPQNLGLTCHTLPNYDTYDQGYIHCYFNGVPASSTYCYWG